MEKLTDNEIIKALKICSDKLIVSCPDDCPLYDECEKDLYVLKRQALDLINRKDAEIERLKEALDGETVKNMRLGHEVERLKAEVKHFQLKNSELFKLNNSIVEENDYRKAEIERLKEYEIAFIKGCALSRCINKGFIQNEAYNEFAEIFKGLLKEYAPYDTLHIYEIQDRIDITSEVLTGGGNEDG